MSDKGLNPLYFPFDPMTVAFFISDRTMALNSIKSYSRWTAALNWLSISAGFAPTYMNDPVFQQFVRGLQIKYDLPPKERMPYKLHHIINTFKHFKLEPDNYKNVPFNVLAEGLIILLYFITASRPSELLYNRYVARNGVDIIIRGLKHGDLHNIEDLHHNMVYWHLIVRSYKNQRALKIYKNIYIANTTCNFRHSHPDPLKGPCICRYFHFTKMLHTYLERKEERGLPMDDDNFLFVYHDGTPIRSETISKLTKLMNNINNIEQFDLYTPYSLRIGGTTRCAMKGIPQVQILRFVGWTASRFVNIANRYVRLAPWELARTPFHMIHGFPNTSNNIKCDIYDPWTEKFNAKRCFKKK